MNRNFHFISGLPRTGSTLLANLMAQHPDVHATPTSGCHDVLFGIRNSWAGLKEHKADKAAAAPKNLQRVLRGALEGYHDTGKPVIIDKARSWIHSVEMTEFVLQRKVKIIVPVRDIASILASFEGLYRKNAHLSNVPGEYLKAQTVEGRCAHWAGQEGELGIAYNRLKDALQRGYGDRLLFVEFEDLTRNPGGTMTRVWNFLGMTAPKHDFGNLVQVTKEDDTVWGMEGMHDVRAVVAPVEVQAGEVIGHDLARKYKGAEFWRSGVRLSFDAPRVRNMDMPLNENLEDLLTWNSLTGAVTRDTLAAEVRGKKVAIVGRDCIGVPPDVDIVVHVNHGLGLTSVPRCDHVVTVTNTHLFATMRELPEGLKQARVFITRDAGRNDTALYAQVFGVSPDKMLLASGDDPQWTSGVWALKLYESLGAEVYAVGFSADRTERYQPGLWHSPRAKDEQTYLQKLKDDGRFFATEVL